MLSNNEVELNRRLAIQQRKMKHLLVNFLVTWVFLGIVCIFGQPFGLTVF